MVLIQKQHGFITDQKHLEYLLILKKCMENYLDKKFVVSKKLHAKKMETRHTADVQIDKEKLKSIIHTIEFYKNRLHL